MQPFNLSILSRKKFALVLATIILITSTFIVIWSINSDECTFEIYIIDKKGEPIRDVFVTVWMWYPGEPSHVVAISKSDAKGLVKFKTSWKKLLGIWLDRYKSGKREGVGLIVDIYDSGNSTVATKVIMLDIKQGNPGIVKRTLIVSNAIEIKNQINKHKEASEGVGLASYTPIVEKTYEHRGRTNIAYVKTDSNTMATIDYVMMKGEKTRARLLVGYTYSDYTSISDPIYTYTHDISKGVTANADLSSTGWISMIMTTRFEIIGYYWQDEDGNLHLMYRELRLWAYDFDINSLSTLKGEDPAWGSYSDDLLKSGTGKGFELIDFAIKIYNIDLYTSSTKILDIPISVQVYDALSAILSKYGFPSSLLPTAKIVIGVTSTEIWTIWGSNGYRIHAYGRYVSVHGVYFMAIDIESNPPTPPGGGPYI